MKTIIYLLLISSLSFVGQSAANDWSPAYSEDQLEIINKRLDKWRPVGKYSKVKDIFKGRSYQPEWESLPEDARPWDWAPDLFKHEQSAIKAGCQCDFIKNRMGKTCLLKITELQGAWLFVYDRDNSGRYIKTDVITPAAWYSIADVQIVDIFGNGKNKMILIEHQGGHGTGSDEKIHWLLGWHKGAFRTIFRETVYLRNAGLGENTIFRMNYNIKRGKKPRIEAKYLFNKVYVTAYPYDFHAKWRDWLFWDDEIFSFYNTRVQDEKLKLSSYPDNRFCFRLNIEYNRQQIIGLPPLPEKMWEYEAVMKYWEGIGGASPLCKDESQ